MLATQPNKFFNHLEYLDRLAERTGASKETVRVTISRAQRAGLLQSDNKGRLSTTWRGKIKARITPTKKLRHYLVIIFDIPEKAHRQERDLLRKYLQANRCEMVQKSVWVTRYDIYEELLQAIGEMGIEEFVSVFTADKLS